MQIVLSQIIPKEFQHIWRTNCPCRYRLEYGGRNTGKSYSLATECIHKVLTDQNRNIVIFRAFATDLKSTIFAEIKKALRRLGVQDKFQVKEHDIEIVYKKTGQKIMFFGCDRGTAINGVQCEIGEITDFYFEEAYELKDVEEFRKMDGSLRGDYQTILPNGRKIPKQITFTMNPWRAEGCWIYDLFVKKYQPDDDLTMKELEEKGYRETIKKDLFIEKGVGLALLQSSYKVNHWRAKNYDDIALANKLNNLSAYKNEFLGMWGVSGDILYTNYSSKLNITHEIASTLPYRVVYIGIDTAYSTGEGKTLSGSALDTARIKHAYSVQLAGITRVDYKGVEAGTLVAIDEYYYSQEIYGRRKTQPELVQDTINAIKTWFNKYQSNSSILKGQLIIYVDSGDPGSIDAMNTAFKNANMSNFTITSSWKKPIITRVRFENQLMSFGRIRFSNNCQHLIREISHSKEGKGKIREDVNDHAINAFEYAVQPMFALSKEWDNFKEYK